MSDELLPYYNRELAYIRRLGGEFAELHPKIAGRLKLTADGTEDPHVSRLIEAFAFLNARIRHKLDDDFPEITDAMLGVLYPHYITPIPSMSIVQMQFDRAQGELTAGYSVPNQSMIETDSVNGDPVRFRTCYPVKLWPVEITNVNLRSVTYSAPVTRFTPDTVAVLRLQLQCMSKEVSFGQLALGALRFFLKGQSQHTFPLYELLFNNVLGIALAEKADDKSPVILERSAIQPVGFNRDEGILPFSPRSFLGYRLLSEFFAFPHKYMFFDLAGLEKKALARFGNRLEIYFYLNRSNTDGEQNITPDACKLGCTPIVNIYRQRAEPIQLTQATTEYRIVPDARRPMATEVYSVDRVRATSPEGDTVEYRPFYSAKHGWKEEENEASYYLTRRPAVERKGEPDSGTEVFLSFVDLNFSPLTAPEWIVDVETTCLSRDLPGRLPFGGDQPHLQLTSGGGPIERLICLTAPSPTLRPTLKHGALWRLISHLSLNHLSIVSDGGADALKEILKLYDFNDSPGTRSMIDGITSMASRRIVGPAGGTHQGVFCRGVEVTIKFDESKYVGSGLFLFAMVLERFLGLYCSINSFTKMIAQTKQREGDLHRWPPRAGEKFLL